MFTVEINFFPREADEIWETDLENLLCAWLQEGNVLGEWQTVRLGKKWQVRVVTPEKNSLQSQNWREYGPIYWQKLQTQSRADFEVRVVGELENLGECCECENPSCFVLFTSYRDLGLPVECGDCGQPIPFYKLPVLEPEKSYWQLFSWQRSYAALDQVFMDSFVGERLAYRQLSNPRSQFSRYTRKIARNLEVASGKPTYFYLLNVYDQRGENCPLCQRNWRWHEPPKPVFEFKCDACRIVSSQATSDEATSLSQLHP